MYIYFRTRADTFDTADTYLIQSAPSLCVSDAKINTLPTGGSDPPDQSNVRILLPPTYISRIISRDPPSHLSFLESSRPLVQNENDTLLDYFEERLLGHGDKLFRSA